MSKLLLPALGLLLAGCGGNSAIGSASNPSGRATFTITWPVPASRIVPSLSQSISITITDGKQFSLTKIVPRPASSTAAVTIEDLPVGTLTDTLIAYPNANGTGIAQASGSATVKVVQDKDTAVTITLASTIDSIKLTPLNPGSIPPGSKLQFAAAALDKAGDMVLAPLKFSTSDPSLATIDPATGLLSAVKVGTVTVTATDPESKVSAEVNLGIGISFTITPANAVLQGYGDSVGLTATSSETLPSGTKYKWTCSVGNISSSGPSFTTSHSYTAATTYATYTEIAPLDGSAGTDTVTVEAVDSAGHLIATATETFSLGGTRFQHVIYSNGNSQTFFEYVAGREFCPASTRVTDFITNYQGIKLDSFYVESAEIQGNGQSPILLFQLMVGPGAMPAVGDKFAVQYYSYLPFLVPGIAQYGGLLSVSFPDDAINGTLTITSEKPDPRGGTFVGYSFVLDTIGGNTTGYGLATLQE